MKSHLEYYDWTEEDFKKRLTAYKTTLKSLFEEGKSLQDEILSGIDKLSL